MPSPRRVPVSGLSRVTLVVGLAVVGIGGTLAFVIPGMVGGSGGVPDLVSQGPAPAPAAAKAAPVRTETPKPLPPSAARKRAAPTATTSENGDLALELELRWNEALSGASVQGVVRFVNTSLESFELPAQGEPHPTLAIVVLDGEGNEVRRVVESGPDPYPRRTTTLNSGASAEMPVLIVSGDDAPLAPGEYSCYAEMRPDPAWARLGLPFWTAPNGPVRSAQATFKLSAPAEK